MRDVDHVNVAVDDLDDAVPFYDEVLALDLLRPPDDFQGDHAMFAAGETVVTLMETGRSDDWDPTDLDHPLDKAHLAFAAEREKYDRLVGDLDGQFPRQGPYDWDEFEGFYFLDTAGNLLEVVTRDPRPDGVDWPLLAHGDVEE
jgi:catechol 2,3-dioxygenase-like lactoylglutathione lyase family enzyme